MGIINYNQNKMPKLYYFDLYGRAETARMALTLAGVAFEDCRVTHEQFAGMKADEKMLEFGQMPMFELDDGTRLCQGSAILNYIDATLAKDGLQQSDDAMKHYNAECTVIAHADDFLTKHVVKALFAPDAEKAAAFGAIITTALPAYLDHMERRLPADGFLLGDKISKYDLQIGVFYAMINQEVENDAMLPFKVAIKAAVATKPKV